MQRTKAVCVAGLQFTVDGKYKAETTEVQGKQVFDCVEDAGMGGAERVLDLLNGRGNFGRVEGQTAFNGIWFIN